MNSLKKVFAVLLVLAMLFSFAGCHKKGEIAVTVDGVEFTSAYYMCALVMADGEARSKVQEEAKETDTEIDYFSKKIDGKKYVDWVKDTALESLKKIAAYKIKCDDAKLKVEDGTVTNTKSYASYYWYNYGYQTLLEPNGISYNTYEQYMLDSNYSGTYFEHVYGKGGEKEIPAKDIEKSLYENFEIANVLEASFDGLKEDEIKKLKEKFDKYYKELKDGKKSFEEVYNDHNGIKPEEDKKDEDKKEEEDKKELEPKDKYATILGTDKTDYASDHFKTVQKMKINEIKLVELDEKKGLVLLIKKEIKADPYYLDSMDLTVRNMLKGDEFEKTMDEFIKTLKLEEDKYATGQFKVKKIKYPEN
ncbi:MAG: hypothetical protein PUF48_00870 [Oscillospiraceae bacterium]|nr:hypothetical protein [Oscillospiraceae bacterium]